MNRAARRCRIDMPADKLAAFCETHHIAKLSVFGSALREDFGPDSDVDVLVEFASGHVPGFLRLHQMEEELSRLAGGRKIDLVTEKFLNLRIRGNVLGEAEVQYAE